MIRWISMIKYPEGVPVTEGDDWYLRRHTQEAKQMAGHGLVGYKTWRALSPRFDGRTQTRAELVSFARLSELWFPDWEAFRSAMAAPIEFSPAPYGAPGFESEQVFVAEEPEFDLLRDTPFGPD